MSEIKTAEQRIHKLEGGEGDSFVTFEQALIAERDELRAALADRDAKLAALAKQEPMAWLVYGNGSHRYSTLTFDVSQVPDIFVGGDVVALYAAAGAAPVPCVVLTPEDRAAFERFHETWEDNEGYDGPKEMMRRLADEAGRYDITKFGHYVLAAGAAPVPEGWRSAVAMAYGHLWHVNNEPMAPIPLRSEESASYAARKLLHDLLTTEERGEAINSVRAMLTASPKDAP